MISDDHDRPVAAPVRWADPAPVASEGAAGRRVLPLVVWVVCLGLAVGLLVALGGGRLAAPPLTDAAAWRAWATTTDQVEVVAVGLRLLALGLAWYLVGVTTISVLARALRAARLIRVADALSVGPVRVLAQQAVGVGLAAGVLAAAVPTAPGPLAVGSGEVPAEVLVATPLPATTGGPAVVRTTSAGADPSAADETIVPVPGPAPAAPAGQAAEAAPPTDDVQPQPSGTGAAARGAARQVRVAPGDHLWALAERDVVAHLGRPVSEAEVADHWRDVVAANTDRLPVPGNPDLLHPGQLVVLPPVTGVAP